VTAQKREERLINVPMSVVVIGDEELQAHRIDNVDDLRLVVPGLAINTEGLQRRIFLRGIANISGSSSQVGTYIDEAAIVTAPDNNLDLRTLDLQRVEVLRGPQGTLFGEGSMGGTIRFITKDPRLDRFEGNTEVSASFTERGEPSEKVQGVVNVPIVDGRLGLRVAASLDNQGGWIDQPAASKKDINDQEIAHVRAKLLWQPTDSFKASAMTNFHHNNGSVNLGEDRNGNWTQVLGLTTRPELDDEYELHNLTLTYNLGGAQVISSSTYMDQDHSNPHVGFCSQSVAPPAPCVANYYNAYDFHTRVFNQELRLSSTGNSRLKWTVGGYYVDSDGSGAVDFFSGSVATRLTATTLSENSSWAVFGDGSFNLTDRLEFGAGVRYFEDERSSDSLPTALNGTPISAATHQEGKFDAVSPKFYGSYAVADNARVYASITKGFRSGGFNGLGRPPYDPEVLWSYELGTKLSAAEGRVTAETALFYSDYRGYQISGVVPDSPTGTGATTQNAGDVAIKGIDWSFGWRVTNQLNLAFNGNYVDTEVVKMNLLRVRLLRGDPVPYVPKYLATMSASYDFSWLGRPGDFRVDYSRTGKAYLKDRSIGPWYYSESDLIDSLNFNASYWLNPTMSVGVFGQNLLDERGYLLANSILGRTPHPRPRTAGIDFRWSFSPAGRP
jgi:outer membrane receptor protein involved in Fe transport